MQGLCTAVKTLSASPLPRKQRGVLALRLPDGESHAAREALKSCTRLRVAVVDALSAAEALKHLPSIDKAGVLIVDRSERVVTEPTDEARQLRAALRTLADRGTVLVLICRMAPSTLNDLHELARVVAAPATLSSAAFTDADVGNSSARQKIVSALAPLVHAIGGTECLTRRLSVIRAAGPGKHCVPPPEGASWSTIPFSETMSRKMIRNAVTITEAGEPSRRSLSHQFLAAVRCVAQYGSERPPSLAELQSIARESEEPIANAIGTPAHAQLPPCPLQRKAPLLGRLALEVGRPGARKQVIAVNVPHEQQKGFPQADAVMTVLANTLRLHPPGGLIVANSDDASLRKAVGEFHARSGAVLLLRAPARSLPSLQGCDRLHLLDWGPVSFAAKCADAVMPPCGVRACEVLTYSTCGSSRLHSTADGHRASHDSDHKRAQGATARRATSHARLAAAASHAATRGGDADAARVLLLASTMEDPSDDTRRAVAEVHRASRNLLSGGDTGGLKQSAIALRDIAADHSRLMDQARRDLATPVAVETSGSIHEALAAAYSNVHAGILRLYQDLVALHCRTKECSRVGGFDPREFQ